jgi:hypothetical protein
MPQQYINGSKAEEKWKFLQLLHLPGRLTTEEAGWLLGFSEAEISILIAKGLLEPLGAPKPNSKKMLATCLLLQAKDNPKLLHKCTIIIHKYIEDRNKGIGGNTSKESLARSPKSNFQSSGATRTSEVA